MAEITEIRDVRGLIYIYMDGTLAFRVAKCHFARKPLRIGEEIEQDEYLDSMAALQMNDAYEAALTSLDFSERTSDELLRSLLRRGFVRPAAEAAVQRLIESGIVDDARYANRIAENAAHKNIGKYALRRKLMSKGISEDEVETALENLHPEQQKAAARETAAKYLRKYEDLPRREARAKLSQALARRGFSWEVVSSVVEELTEED